MCKKRDFVTYMKSAFNPVHLLAQLFGLAQYSFVDAEENVDVSWNSNRQKYVWSVLLLIIQIIGVLYRIAINFVKPPTSIAQLCSNVIHLPLVQAAGPLVVILSLVRNRTKVRKFVMILSRADEFLYESKDQEYVKPGPFLVVAVTCSLIYVVPQYLVQNFISKVHFGWILVLSHLTCLVNDLQYLNAILILKHRLVAINDRLKSIPVVDYCLRGEFKVSTEFVNRCRRHVSGTTSRPVTGNRSVFTVQSFETPATLRCSVSRSRSEIACIILRFRQTYNAMYEMCCLTNSMYGCTVLLNWLMGTVGLSVDLYYVSAFFIRHSTLDIVWSSTAMNVSLLLSGIFTLVRMFVIALSCKWVSDECQTCVSNVQLLLLEYNTEEDVLTQLIAFSDQLMINKIEFTACGIFPMNLSVLCTVAGLVIQYLILLCQMRDSAKP